MRNRVRLLGKGGAAIAALAKTTELSYYGREWLQRLRESV